MSQMVGDWIFNISDRKSKPEDCRVEKVLANFTEVRVHLDPDKLARLAAHDNGFQLTLAGNVNVGPNSASWSPIYDEGLIVRYQEGNEWITLYGQFEYIKDEKVKTPSSGVQENGTTPGYISHCDTIFRGWAISENTQGAGEKSVSCLSALKAKEPGSIQPHPRLSANRPSSASAPSSNLVIPDKLPLPVNHIVFSRPEIQQQNCGSCYVYSFAYALERSFEKQLTAIAPSAIAQVDLDRQVMLSCAYSSEGCNGGYFESLTLDMSVRGIPMTAPTLKPKEPTVTGPTSQTLQGCPTKRLEDVNTLYYPKTFISVQSEREIKESIVSNGPVLVSVYMLQNQQVGPGGIRRLLQSPESPRGTEWDYLNHGIVLIGWDRQGADNYWIAYNPWGIIEHIQMGGESEWIYKYAVSIVPDLCRGAPLQTLIQKLGNEAKARIRAGCRQ